MIETNPPKVVSIISRMNIGGPAILLAPLFSELVGSGISHYLFTGSCESNEVDFLSANSVESVVIYIEGLGRKIRIGGEFLALIKLIRALKNVNPDLIHTHTSKAGVLGRIAARVACPSAKVVHTYHGHILYGYFSPNTTKLIVLIERALAKISTVLVSITNQVKEDLLSAGVGKKSTWRVIPIGIKQSPDITLGSVKETRPGISINLIWVGRFTPIKNPFMAIRSFEIAFRQFPELRLTMVGGGELLEQCRSYAIHQDLPINFTGWSENVDENMEDKDLLLLTSENEGMGMVVLEAAAHQIPTLSTNVGGVNEFIEDGISGFFAQNNLESFSTRLVEILHQGPQRRLVGQNAMNLYLSKFTSDRFIRDHINLYKELLEQ